MKRDLNLIRQLVLDLEKDVGGLSMAGLDDYPQDLVGYHRYLLVDAGLAVGKNVTGMSDSHPQFMVTHLTWAGHEFADAIRDDATWNRARKEVKDKAGSVSVSVLGQLLAAIAMRALGLP